MIKNIKNNDKLVFGSGSFNQLDDILKSKRNQSFMVFLVDDIFKNKPLCERIPLQQEDKLIWVNVDLEPKTEKVDKLKEEIMAITGKKPDGVIGIGGGSVMDYAKAVSVMLNHPGSSSQYQGLNLAYNPPVYHVGVPTLSGTGAEVSMTAVLTGPEKKLGIKYDGTPFNQVILDPELITEAPVDQRFYTGMDCYIHNVEALQGITSNPFSNALANQSLKLCHEVFLDKKISRTKADAKLMVASYLGGMSLSYSEVGVCHAFSYGLSYVMGLHHGIANCIAFNQLQEFYPEGVSGFKEMLKVQKVTVPEKVTARLSDSDINRMIETSWALSHMWNHALGKDWEHKISKDKLAEIYRRM
ncbi:MAG: iron-containing alcohol dehydrogenase [Calditrichaceae bacterium]|nr:iron-containing alcohol dehydrogenase [Calditrichaceae bacterium]